MYSMTNIGTHYCRAVGKIDQSKINIDIFIVNMDVLCLCMCIKLIDLQDHFVCLFHSIKRSIRVL